MNTISDITGGGHYLFDVGQGPFVIRVYVLHSRANGYVYFTDIPQSFPGHMMPDLLDLLEAVHDRMERLNKR